MSSLKIPSIETPIADVRSLRSSLGQVKEAVEIIAGTRNPSPFPTWDDLVRLGIVQRADVPKK